MVTIVSDKVNGEYEAKEVAELFKHMLEVVQETGYGVDRYAMYIKGVNEKIPATEPTIPLATINKALEDGAKLKLVQANKGYPSPRIDLEFATDKTTKAKVKVINPVFTRK
jgi:hypothetical protein